MRCTYDQTCDDTPNLQENIAHLPALPEMSFRFCSEMKDEPDDRPLLYGIEDEIVVVVVDA